MTRVLVTGATGFVGANLARRLLRDGHTVHLLVRTQHAPWRIEAIRSQVQLHTADLGSADELKAIVQTIRPAWVFHLAVHGAYPAQTQVREMIQTNLAATVNLVEACLAAGCEVLVNAGSSSEYGLKDHAPAETEALEPNSFYAVTKAAATWYCRYIARTQPLRLPTLRLYSVYGPYEAPSRLMPTLVVHGLRGEWPPLVDPDVARDYVYVDDVVEAFCRAASQPGRELGAIYNVGTGRQTSLREVVDVARVELGIAAEPAWGSLARREWDTHVWVSDNRKLRAELGWEPRYTLARGFHELAQWFRDNPAWEAWYRRAASAA